MFIIYKITNKVNGKIYIGQTTQGLKVRLGVHFSEARKGKTNSVIHAAIRKYGKENFDSEEICRCKSKKQMDDAEKFYIRYFKARSPIGYNLTDGGEGVLGWVPSAEWRKNTSESQKGKQYRLGMKATEETKAKISRNSKGNTYCLGHKHTEETLAKMRARVPTEETRAKISAACMGNKNSLGHKHTAETCAKMSIRMKGNQIMLGYKHSPETCAKMSAGHIGLKHTEETKAKMKGKNNIMFGKHHSEETKRKMSESKKGTISWNKGKTGIYTEETIQKMRDAIKKRIELQKLNEDE